MNQYMIQDDDEDEVPVHVGTDYFASLLDHPVCTFKNDDVAILYSKCETLPGIKGVPVVVVEIEMVGPDSDDSDDSDYPYGVCIFYGTYKAGLFYT